MSDTSKSWFDSITDILNKPLPGTEAKSVEVQKPVIHDDDSDDESLLDTITDILSKPLPGTVTKQAEQETRTDEGEAAIREAQSPEADPVSTTAAASADWMQREYERFNAHQEQSRTAFTAQQQAELEHFMAYQRHHLEQFGRSQERERAVFKQHQEARFRAWQASLQQTFSGAHRPPMPGPGMMPPPPPPWWRKT